MGLVLGSMLVNEIVPCGADGLQTANKMKAKPHICDERPRWMEERTQKGRKGMKSRDGGRGWQGLQGADGYLLRPEERGASRGSRELGGAEAGALGALEQVDGFWGITSTGQVGCSGAKGARAFQPSWACGWVWVSPWLEDVVQEVRWLGLLLKVNINNWPRMENGCEE